MPKWASSSGVGPIPGDSRPSPGDMINEAEEQAKLERLAANAGTTLYMARNEMPEPGIHGIKLSFSNPRTESSK